MKLVVLVVEDEPPVREAVLADLTVRGLAQIEEPVVLGTDDRTGLPVLAVGRRVTSAEVADLLDDE